MVSFGMVSGLIGEPFDGVGLAFVWVRVRSASDGANIFGLVTETFQFSSLLRDNTVLCLETISIITLLLMSDKKC